MKQLSGLLLLLFVGLGSAQASADLASGSLYRTARVPQWSAGSGTFTIMLWVYAPSITGSNDFFNADDGGALGVYVNIGSAADSPTEPYFLTRNGEWHFNRDGSFVANPAQSFDVTRDWTFLAVTLIQGGATDLYAWQAGVNGDALVHVPAQSTFSTIGGNGPVTTFVLGNESNFRDGCGCLMGPIYVYDGVALTHAQIDAQRQQAAPIIDSGLIVYSSLMDRNTLALDQSGTANWSVHGSLALGASNPPVAGLGSSSPIAAASSSNVGSSDSSGGGAMDAVALLGLLLTAMRRFRRSPAAASKGGRSH